jgi:hypothetical protein
LTITFDDDVAAHSTIVVVGFGWKSATNWGPVAGEFTDTQTNTYNRVDYVGTNNPATTIMYAYNVTGGANTVTINPAGSGWYLGFVAYELAPIEGFANPLDTWNYNEETSGTPNSGRVIPSQTNEIAFSTMTVNTTSITSLTGPDGILQMEGRMEEWHIKCWIVKLRKILFGLLVLLLVTVL